MHRNKVLLLSMTMLLGASLVLGGCQAAKKPQPTNPGTVPAPSNQTQPTTPKQPSQVTPNKTTQAYPRSVATKVVNEANRVSGVRGSSAVITGKNVYLGLDLNGNMDRAKRAQVEKNVLNKVKNLQPGYTVTVTSDINTVTRIRKVSQGINQGKPISTFTRELQDIGNSIKPKTK